MPSRRALHRRYGCVRWTAAFFAVATLAHVWWLAFYIFSSDMNSTGYQVLVILDCVLLFTTFAGMLLAMLQDRRRKVWPALAAMIPFVLLGVAFMVYLQEPLEMLAEGYLLLLGLAFTGYMVVAIRQYRLWLNDNYVDLENKRVWLCQAVSLICMLLFMLYSLATDMILIWLIHIIELVLVGLLMWRVETLPTLEVKAQERSAPLTPKAREDDDNTLSIDLNHIEQLLKEHCVAQQLYLKHETSLEDLAQVIGTNRYYLSQYFSRQGITYNIYINSQRVTHFINRYEELVKAGQSVAAKQLAHESGFSSYRTFSRAFTQYTGQSVTDWMRERGG